MFNLFLPSMLLQFPVVLGESTSPVLNGLILEAFFKFVFVLIAALYLLFAFVMTRQIHIMKNTLITPIAPVIALIGYLHLLFAAGVLIFFLVAL